MAISIGNADRTEYNAAIVGDHALTQLLHDIASPIAALGACVRKLENGISKDATDLLRLTSDRLSSMVDAQKTKKLAKQKINIFEIFEAVTKEKQHYYSLSGSVPFSKDQIHRMGQKNDMNLAPEFHCFGARDAFAFADAPILGRAISNMLNNSIEAGATAIWIDVKSGNEFCTIVIKDNGHGIDKSLKPFIGIQGQTSKIGGQGLGLSHAIKSVQEWGGSLTIESNPRDLRKSHGFFGLRSSDNFGTTITIQLKV